MERAAGKRYISYSELYSWRHRGREAYFSEYIVGIKEPPSPQQTFGKIVHRILDGEKFDWEQELVKEGFTSDFIRITKKIAAEVPKYGPELKIFQDLPEFCLYAGIDGNTDSHLIEYKTGASFWTQERVDQDEQLTHYCFVWSLKTGELKPYKLISINSKNGKHQVFETVRTQAQLENWLEGLKQFKTEMESLGWWDKKLAMKDRL